MEMQALYLLARTVSRLADSLECPIANTTLWTDSTTSIQWLQKDQGEAFIRNRVKILRPFLVKHIGTSDNPADLASRGCKVSELIDNQQWFHGPEWLQKSEELWPLTEFIHDPNKPTTGKEAEEINLAQIVKEHDKVRDPPP